MKYSTSYRISDEARRILERLAKKNGISKTAMLEIILRDAGKRENQ